MNKQDLDFAKKIANSDGVKTTETYDLKTGEYRLLALDESGRAFGEYKVEKISGSCEAPIKLLKYENHK